MPSSTSCKKKAFTEIRTTIDIRKESDKVLENKNANTTANNAETSKALVTAHEEDHVWGRGGGGGVGCFRLTTTDAI